MVAVNGRLASGRIGSCFGFGFLPSKAPAVAAALTKPQQRAAPSYVPSYSSRIMVPSITQLCWGSGQTMIDEIFILKRIK